MEKLQKIVYTVINPFFISFSLLPFYLYYPKFLNGYHYDLLSRYSPNDKALGLCSYYLCCLIFGSFINNFISKHIRDTSFINIFYSISLVCVMTLFNVLDKVDHLISKIIFCMALATLLTFFRRNHIIEDILEIDKATENIKLSKIAKNRQNEASSRIHFGYYNLDFKKPALEEWDKLDQPIRKQFIKRFDKILKNPRSLNNILCDFKLTDCYKTKLENFEYYLIYSLENNMSDFTVLALGKYHLSKEP